MKKILLTIFAIATAVMMSAQNYDVLDIVKIDRSKVAGCEGPYRFDAPALTAAPKGYTPFFINHYGRHGSRFAWSDKTYTVVKSVMDEAAKTNSLTEFGKKFYEDYNNFYQTPLINTGDLSALGFQQHKQIASLIAKNFPEIFAKGGEVLARATTSQRAIVSMSGFCVGLQQSAPQVNITANSLHTNMIIINSTSAPSEMREMYEGNVIRPAREGRNDYLKSIVDYNKVLNKLFTNTDFFKNVGGMDNFTFELQVFWANYINYTDDRTFEYLFDEDEYAGLWEAHNINTYTDQVLNKYQFIPLLRDFIAAADDAISGGKYVGNFRFGHDTVVNPFMGLLNINGTGKEVDNYKDIKYWYQNYNCPMAANIQMIYYRSKKSNDILFKVLLNGAEATLPQLEAVSGPYYKWSDFVNWANDMMAQHPRRAAMPVMPRR